MKRKRVCGVVQYGTVHTVQNAQHGQYSTVQYIHGDGNKERRKQSLRKMSYKKCYYSRVLKWTLEYCLHGSYNVIEILDIII